MLWRAIQLGVKSLLLHPLRSSLTMLGIFIGVTSVIWLLAISEGISRAAQKQIEDLGVTNIILRSVLAADDELDNATFGDIGGDFFVPFGIKRSDYTTLVTTIPTIRNALRRRSGEGEGGTPVELQPDDFEVERTEHLTRSSTVLMLEAVL